MSGYCFGLATGAALSGQFVGNRTPWASCALWLAAGLWFLVAERRRSSRSVRTESAS